MYSDHLGYRQFVSDFRTVFISLAHSGKSATIPESNHGSGVFKEHYSAKYYVPKKLHFVSQNWRMEN